MYVPNLQFDMIEAAEESFMPYIVGIQKKHLGMIDVEERVVVDVDGDKVCLNSVKNFEELPERYEKYFISNSSNKNYLEWEKEIRINAILFMSDLLSEGCFCQSDQLLRMSKQER
mgnify:CR=1 FL=1